MRYRHLIIFTTLSFATFALSSCGAGNGNPNDVIPNSPVTVTPTSGPDSFLLFPNPQVQPDGSLQTNSAAYTQAYYAAIDPLNLRTTLAGFKTANGFGSGTGTEVHAVFGDSRDLGYGRLMTARQNADGTVAFIVGNYAINAGGVYGYSTLNLDAAVAQDALWLKSTSALEFSPGPSGGLSFAKFYSYDPAGNRLATANLDGRGAKAMPGICISCHGGRADPLTPPDNRLGGTGLPLFPLVANSATQARGDVQAHLHVVEADAVGFSTAIGSRRVDLEAAIKAINKIILSTYPLPTGTVTPTGFAEDVGRRVATANEWQGTAANLIKNAYGGNGLPNASFVDTYLPTDWTTNGQTTLYQSTVAPACRICHLMRGTAQQSDIDLDTFAKFQGYASRIKEHVIDRGDMPLAKIVYDKYYATAMVNNMALFLSSAPLAFVTHDGAGAALRPGRPIADPGPDRTTLTGAIPLSAAASLYSTGYQWSITSGPIGATLTNPTASAATLNAAINGTYVLQLITSKGATQSTAATLSIVVNSALTPVPSAINFTNIKTVLQTGGCTACHTTAGTAPINYSNIDRNGDTLIDATDDVWLYTEVRGRINFNDIESSPLLRKPTGEHHAGGLLTGFDNTKPPGDPLRNNYDLFLNWILNGAPQ